MRICMTIQQHVRGYESMQGKLLRGFEPARCRDLLPFTQKIILVRGRIAFSLPVLYGGVECGGGQGSVEIGQFHPNQIWTTIPLWTWASAKLSEKSFYF